MARSSLLIDVVLVDSLECPILSHDGVVQDLMDKIGFSRSGDSEWPWQVGVATLFWRVRNADFDKS